MLGRLHMFPLRQVLRPQPVVVTATVLVRRLSTYCRISRPVQTRTSVCYPAVISRPLPEDGPLTFADGSKAPEEGIHTQLPSMKSRRPPTSRGSR